MVDSLVGDRFPGAARGVVRLAAAGQPAETDARIVTTFDRSVSRSARVCGFGAGFGFEGDRERRFSPQDPTATIGGRQLLEIGRQFRPRPLRE
jgi:hypothetical protein